MSISEITKLRKCGVIRFHSIFQYPLSLNEILTICGLKPNAERLIEVNASEAKATLVYWLHREPAYHTELMPLSHAESLAASFINGFSDSTSRFFTNGRWFDPNWNSAWAPLSDFTFDGGVLIESGEGNDTRHVCLWFSDED